MDAFHAHSSASSTSHKARYRPGKAPAIKRTESIMSLPSPPSDYDHEVGEDGMDVDDGVPAAPLKPAFAPARGGFEEDDEVDQLDSDTDVEIEEDERAASPVPAKRRACALGSPANLVGGGGASRRQLLNPFLQPAAGSSISSSFSASSARPSASSTAYTSPTRSDFHHPHQHLHSSPVRKRRAADPDRIRLSTAGAVTPPQKSRAELAAERKRQEEDEERERKKRMMGWDDPENPFVERNEGAMAARLREKKQMKRPETITLVKRGQRIQTSVPFTAVLTSTSTDDDPFTFTAPKLLFPPKAPSPPSHTHPSTPPQQSKFLEALRAAGASERKPAPPPAPPASNAGAQLPPTPVTLKRKAPAAPAVPPQGSSQAPQARFGPYKKMRGLNGGAGAGAHVEGGLR
ncbi:hypothetical protein JCM6882_004037 [Rhodosporidiobolus microsporus]